MSNQLERNILQNFFKTIFMMQQLDNSISDSKVIRDTQNKLKSALRNVTEKCSCAKSVYSICEVCQGSDRELVSLRNFFREIRNAKKNNMDAALMQEFVKNTKKDLIFE